jgi:hypothetical protein
MSWAGYRGELGAGKAMRKHGVDDAPKDQSALVFEAHPLFGNVSERMVGQLMAERQVTRERILQLLKETS